MTQDLKITIDIANLEDSLGIHNTLKKNLIEIRDIEKITKKQKKELEDKGFLRKEVGIEYFRNLITNPYTDIYIAKINDGTIIGFATIHKKKYNIIKVRDVIGNLSFENEKSKDLLLNEETEFAYLDQISIFPDYKRKGIGTAIFQKALKSINTPIVAFIVEKPLFNKASAHWHENNGFKFSGISGGKYKGKSFKFQIFIHWNQKEH
ncbi:MAG: GNAT family N-acetyltransferase [Candidatus Hodarchaeota archaeon]